MSTPRPAGGRLFGQAPGEAPITGYGLHADIRGPAGAPALLYLHGGPGQGAAEFMALQGGHLSRDMRLVGLDQRGAGRSAPLPEGARLTIADLIDDCEEVRRALRIERWAVLGHSFGGALALRYAVAHPGVVTAVVFENPVWDTALSCRAALPRLAAMLARRGRLAEAETARAAVEREVTPRGLRAAYDAALAALGSDGDTFFVTDPVTRKRLHELRGDAAGRQDGNEQRHRAAILRDEAYYESLLPLLPGLGSPALLIRGRLDPLTSAEQVEAFRAASSRNRLVVFERAGHFVQADDPAGYAQAVTVFLRAVGAGAESGTPRGGMAGSGTPRGGMAGGGTAGGRAAGEAPGERERPAAAAGAGGPGREGGPRSAREAAGAGAGGRAEAGPPERGARPAAGEWSEKLRAEAAGYAHVALANIRREFPSGIRHTMRGPGDFPHRPRARTPVFYGSYDWHSCVEMHWLLVRLLRVAPGAVPAADIRTALRSHFNPVALAAEAEFIAGPDGRSERPYGWGWALALVHETSSLDDPEARHWADALRPLADTVVAGFLDWLPKATYPVRCGTHPNSAFALSLALPHARRLAAAGSDGLLGAIISKVYEWYGADMLCPADWEPSGQDFLSPALTEAELMASILPPAEFAEWLSLFLPGVAGAEPRSLFTPVTVSDASDGQIAHLHGLNASRAWCWRRIAGTLPPGDARIEPALAAARAHAAAALPHVAGDDYMVEHWLAAYAVLLLS